MYKKNITCEFRNQQRLAINREREKERENKKAEIERK